MVEENKTFKIGINGFGRIGRLFARKFLKNCETHFLLAAINDPCMTAESMAYFLAYDSIHGKFPLTVNVKDEKTLIVEEYEIQVSSNKETNEIPWGNAGIDLVVDCSGVNITSEECQSHLESGVSYVIISAPAKDEITPTIVHGFNHESFNPDTMKIVSNGSCTTNALVPLLKILLDNFGIEECFMSTIHAVTASQSLVDRQSKKDLRYGRCATRSIIPTTTGASVTIKKLFPELEGKIKGLAFRVPVENVSVIDLTAKLSQPLSGIERLGALILEIEDNPSHPLHGLISKTNEPVVSIDFNQDEHSCILDLGASLQLNDTFVKLVAYYDNEWAYAVRLFELTKFILSKK